MTTTPDNKGRCCKWCGKATDHNRAKCERKHQRALPGHKGLPAVQQ